MYLARKKREKLLWKYKRIVPYIPFVHSQNNLNSIGIFCMPSPYSYKGVNITYIYQNIPYYSIFIFQLYIFFPYILVYLNI